MNTIIRTKSLFKLQCFEDEVIKQHDMGMEDLLSMLRKSALGDLVSDLKEASFKDKGVKDNRAQNAQRLYLPVKRC